MNVRDDVGNPATRRSTPSNGEPGRFAIRSMLPGRVTHPKTPADVAGLLAEATSKSEAVVPWGGGTHQGIGAGPERYDIACDMSHVNELVAFEPADLVVTVEAGMTLGRVQDHLREKGKFLALDGGHPEISTIGGMLATNTSGPSRLLYGSARDLVLGMQVALPNGDLVRSGGKVVKNVVGYDLNKLHIGALGTVGTICEVTFKVHPLPRSEGTILAHFDDFKVANEVAERLARSNLSLRSVIAFSGSLRSAPADIRQQAGTTVAVWCAGWPAAVERQKRDVIAALSDAGASAVFGPNPQAHEAFWDAIARPTTLGVQFKLASLPSRIGELVAVSTALAAETSPASPEWIVYSGVGIARLEIGGGSAEIIRRIRDAAASRGGTCVVASADGIPIDSVLAWGPVRDDFPLMQRVKSQFDPKRTLNPGRFVGGI
ncbi:MAG: FAD-binding oxidoreductase [Chloroflexi bacterium]|nr:FAD-binding oxidoreductase [Chloroflexota bacterium]